MWLTCSLFVIGEEFLMRIIMTWIFNNTHRSTLSAILWHAVVNGTCGLFTMTERARDNSIALLSVAAVVIAKIWGGGAKTLTGRGAAAQSLYQ
jgi:uncharacterized membrane-anchored protein